MASSIPNLLTIPQFATKHPAFTQSSVRWHVFNASSNGLAESRAVIRIGKRVYIDEQKWFEWVASQQSGAVAA